MDENSQAAQDQESISQDRILIADDEDIFLIPTSKILQAHGYLCDCVHTVQEAEDCLRKNSYDLMMIDINMPGNRNLEFLRDRASDASFLPVLIVTGYPSLDSAVECLRLSVVDYIIKPVISSDLLKVCSSAIQKGKALRKTQGMRRDFSQWLNKMQEMETSLLSSQGTATAATKSGTLDWYLDETVRQFTNISLNLVSTIRSLKQSGGDANENVCTLMSCPRLTSYQRGVQDAVDVLVHTKNSFKSKELGELRKKLEALLQV
jgi:DNA-binding response OmpR family regulator